MPNLEQFAQSARRQLREQVTARLEQVLRTDSVELRQQQKAVEALQTEINRIGRAQVIEAAAYTWFNRFCALRFMDVNHYSRVKVVSPVEGFTQPEILQEAKTGHLDPDLPLDAARVLALLSGQTPAAQPQAEAYRLLLTAACNAYHKQMPFLFEPISHYTELLLPTDLLSESSVLQAVRDALTPAACADVEVIGWLYQYYIAERKDEVFANLKKGQKIGPADIPAATQLFTPHWIVRYLVENSLGRLWLQHRPQSRLAEVMEYYIAPESPPNPPEGGMPSDSPLRGAGGAGIGGPEDIRLCDPACGSGHMLTYAFDLLTRIYEEEGYPAADIPRLILQKNLTGLEISPRAAALAAFALTMRARQYDRRFLRRGVTPHIVLLQPVTLTDREIDDYMEAVGLDTPPSPPQGGAGQHSLPAPQREPDQNPPPPPKGGSKHSNPIPPTGGLGGPSDSPLWGGRGDFETTLTQFTQADTFGALIRPHLTLRQAQGADLRRQLADRFLSLSKEGVTTLFLHATHRKVLQILDYAEALSQRYHVVIANPPYMGSKGMNGDLKKFLQDEYTDVKSDLFSAFIVRNLELALPGGQLGFMSPFVWMFISSYEKLREFLIDHKTITSLIQLEYSGFEGATVPICTFTLENSHRPNLKGAYIRLSDFRGAVNQAPKTLEAIRNPDCGWFYRAPAADFKKIPGSPIAYWVSDRVREVFENSAKLSEVGRACAGIQTGNNDLYLRQWFEVESKKIHFPETNKEYQNNRYWLPHKKGGKFRRWYGNCDFVMNWQQDGYSIKNNPSALLRNMDYMFKSGITWSHTSSGIFSVRLSPPGFTFNVEGPTFFSSNDLYYLGMLASKPALYFMGILNPTLHFLVGSVSMLPVPPIEFKEETESIVGKLVELGQSDWDAYETSWDFTTLPLLAPEHRRATLAESYAALRQQWQANTLAMQRLEEENNRIFINAYGLQNELTPAVPLREITLTCNPAYRYGGNKSEAALEKRLRQDTVKEFISYAVGCMLGRYSLDAPGLILANQGQTAADYLAQIPNPTFPPDEDNVIPILDEGWFSDDIVARFKEFLRLTFGRDHYQDNLAFIEKALGKEIRAYFVRDFYKDHVQTYKKRPIYWLFSSKKGSFQALISMHRYRPDTVSVALNGYLRQYRAKLTAHRAHLEQVSVGGSTRDKTQALKELDRLHKTLVELKEYEDDILYPLATQKIDIDLDDGVKVNYEKFGSALKKI